ESEFLNDLFYETSPLSTQGGSLDADQILELFEQRVVGQFLDEPIVEARLRKRLGKILLERGEHKRAEGHLARAWKVFREHLGDDHPETLATRLEYAGILQGKHRAFGIGAVQEVLNTQLRTLPPDDPAVLATSLRLAEALLDVDRKE